MNDVLLLFQFLSIVEANWDEQHLYESIRVPSLTIFRNFFQIVSQVGRKNNCTFCGVFRRQALDRGAMLLGVNKIVTGSIPTLL